MIQIGSRYQFAPGGFAAYEAWYKTFTHEHQISGIWASDVFKVVRFSDDHETEWLNGAHVRFDTVDGLVNIWMPARYVDVWLEQVSAGEGK